ncbi:ISAs1 family transposase [Streptomyces sp. NPDC055692]|uniref:ISAs1 family transposase n=1 Tax=Streptomyces sp. NPDC055692 TaxID=3155683 RepID=UPI00343A1B2F
MSSSLIGVLQRHREDVDLSPSPAELSDLTSLSTALDRLSDPRRVRGRRYRLGSLLALCLLAVLGGATTLAGIARFAINSTPEVRKRIGLDRLPRATTLGRLLSRVDGDALDDAVGAWLARHSRDPVETGPPELVGLAVDGKAVRGSRDGGKSAIHLLAAVLHENQTVISQRQIAAKSNEIPAFAPLLERLDLRGHVITADAMHTQTDHAEQISAQGAHYILVVKGNQCATRRFDTSPLQAGQTRREVCWVRWLTWIRKVKGTTACQETGGRAQVPGAVRRGTRAVWRKLDCLNPNLQRQQFTATGTAPETGARRDRGRTGSPWSTFAAGAMPSEGIEGDEWGAWAALIVCQGRTWDHRPSTAGGDGVPVVVAGVTPGRGEREGRSQGEGAQVVRTPQTPGGMRNAER